MSNRKKPTTAKNEEEDPVDQLLQSAQDELLLKLSVDSHMSRVSPDYLLSDLDRRFQALKSRPTTTTIQSSTIISKPRPSKSQDDVDPDDLFGRFAALKAPNNTTSSSIVSCHSGLDQGDVGDEEDEVEKIIRWAKDSARLDPSPLSDEDEDDHDDVGEDDSEKIIRWAKDSARLDHSPLSDEDEDDHDDVGEDDSENDDKGGNVREKGHHRK